MTQITAISTPSLKSLNKLHKFGQNQILKSKTMYKTVICFNFLPPCPSISIKNSNKFSQTRDRQTHVFEIRHSITYSVQHPDNKIFIYKTKNGNRPYKAQLNLKCFVPKIHSFL